MKETHEYDDIINLDHHVSKIHKPMDSLARAAQFAPFAALTGHDEAIKETARLTEKEKIIDENFKNILDEKIIAITQNRNQHPEITITFFLPDSKKSGGSYQTKTGNLKKIDDVAKLLIFLDGTKIPLKDIVEIK